MAAFHTAEEIKQAALSYIGIATLDFPELREKLESILTRPDSIEIDLSAYPEDTADLLTTFIWANGKGIQG